jgi:hypothetical protein
MRQNGDDQGSSGSQAISNCGQKVKLSRLWELYREHAGAECPDTREREGLRISRQFMDKGLEPWKVRKCQFLTNSSQDHFAPIYLTQETKAYKVHRVISRMECRLEALCGGALVVTAATIRVCVHSYVLTAWHDKILHKKTYS